MRYKILFLLIQMTFLGCSQQSVYEAIHYSLKQECLNDPNSRLRSISDEECIENTEKTYEAYKREREEWLNKST